MSLIQGAIKSRKTPKFTPFETLEPVKSYVESSLIAHSALQSTGPMVGSSSAGESSQLVQADNPQALVTVGSGNTSIVLPHGFKFFETEWAFLVLYYLLDPYASFFQSFVQSLVGYVYGQPPGSYDRQKPWEFKTQHDHKIFANGCKCS